VALGVTSTGVAAAFSPSFCRENRSGTNSAASSASTSELGPIATSEAESLLPDRWIQEHPEHLIQKRVNESRQRARRTRARRAQRRRLPNQQPK